MAVGTTNTIRIHIDERDVLHIVGLPGSTQTIAEARENVREVARLAGPRRRPLLVDMRAVKYLDREARDLYASEEGVALATCIAVLVGSEVTRMLVNLIFSAMPSRVPTRSFTDPDRAYAWLQSLREVAARRSAAGGPAGGLERHDIDQSSSARRKPAQTSAGQNERRRPRG